MTFDAACYRRERQDRMAAERLDVLESVCCVKGCQKSASISFESVFGPREFCRPHALKWWPHYRIVARILSL